MRYKKIIILFLLITAFSFQAGAQSSFCEEVEPFCAGNERLTFPNSNYQNSNQTSGELGPNYGCLDEQPYPAWFYLQIEEGGELIFNISQYSNEDLSGAPLDVDFVIWGPFQKGDDFCSASTLNEENIIDCSYLPDAVEVMSIPNAQANEIYVVVITNFEQSPGFISLQQTNTGADQGSTDCSILDSTLGDDIIVCGEDEYILDGSSEEAETFEWYVFNEVTGQYEIIPGEDGPMLTVTESGDYRLVVTDILEENTEKDDVTVSFYEIPKIGNTSEVYQCKENTSTIDLTQNEQDLITPNSASGEYEAVYYASQEDVSNEAEISQPEAFNFTDGATVYVRVRDLESGCLSETKAFQLIAFEFPDLQLPDTLNLCINEQGQLIAPAQIGKDLGVEFSYEWTGGGDILSYDPILSINNFPTFTEVNLEITHLNTGCEQNIVTALSPIYPAEGVSVEISGSDFGEGYKLTANREGELAVGNSEYEFQLDNGEWQVEKIFREVSAGRHTLRIREIHGCGESASIDFTLIGYPRFFTPNSDGYNDTWKIINDAEVSIKELYIFDRYGKLLKQLEANGGKGWDGTYRGKPLPADDYWFKVEFKDQETGEIRQYSANFTLIR